MRTNDDIYCDMIFTLISFSTEMFVVQQAQHLTCKT